MPENGKANKAMAGFLAKIFPVVKSDLKLKSGSKSRFKCIEINLPVELIEREIKQLCA